MPRYRLVIAYDGTAYSGWQRQPAIVQKQTSSSNSAISNKERHRQIQTIVGTLESAYYKVFGSPVQVVGASRTDAGVHALGQVASVAIERDIDPEVLRRAWQGRLPEDIVLRSVTRVDESFHPRRAVMQKEYQYRISTVRPLPFITRYCWLYYRPFDSVRLQQILQVFVGTHDFRSFCTGYDSIDTVRRIDSIRVHFDRRMRVYIITFKGPGFLRYMIRRIVGAALGMCSNDLQNNVDGVGSSSAQERLSAILEQKSQVQQLLTAPAHGLVLRKIIYQQST